MLIIASFLCICIHLRLSEGADACGEDLVQLSWCVAGLKPNLVAHPALPPNYRHQRRFYFYQFTTKPVISAMTGCRCWEVLGDQLAQCRVV